MTGELMERDVGHERLATRCTFLLLRPGRPELCLLYYKATSVSESAAAAAGDENIEPSSPQSQLKNIKREKKCSHYNPCGPIVSGFSAISRFLVGNFSEIQLLCERIKSAIMLFAFLHLAWISWRLHHKDSMFPIHLSTTVSKKWVHPSV